MGFGQPAQMPQNARLVRLAWLLAALALVNELADTAITAVYRPLFSEETIAVHGWPLNSFAVVGSATMGALIISRYPRHPVGWLLSAVGAGASVSLLLEAYSIWVLDHDGPGSALAGHATGWFSVLSGGPYALTLLAVMFLIAPDGHLLSPRWRYAAVVGFAGLGCFVVGLLILPGISAGDMVIDTDETGGAAIDHLFDVGLWLITAAVTAAVVSLVMRMRRTTGVLRQQLQWIAASGVFLPAGLVWRQVVQASNGGQQTWAATLPLLISYACIPIFTAMAILRYRLYDVQVIVNRAVVLAVGTAFAAVAYVAVVVALGGELASRTGGFWPSMLATVAVALAFQPLRANVTRLADRAAYGSRAVPYEALADFSQRLGETPDPKTLLPAVAEAAAKAVGARRATAALFVHGADAETATWPALAEAGTVSLSVDVHDSGELLGSIAVEMPPGRGLRDGEPRLLQDLADQAAVAFRNAALDAASRAHLEALNRQTEQLAASRRRIVEARYSQRRRLEAAISRDVLPKLERVAASVTRLHDSVVCGGPVDGAEEPITDVTAALDSLRRLSHGVFPTQLERSGIGPALATLVARTDPPLALDLDPSAEGRRFGPRAEAAAYFCCVEALAACSGAGSVRVRVDDEDLVMSIDGVDTGTFDVESVSDRVEALTGTVTLETVGTSRVLEVRLPIAHEAALERR